jgi:aminoglycoside/choline kinase family phosphotransferase
MSLVEDFVHEVYASNNLEIIPLAGDASARRYYRIVNGDESAVLMHWEPFKDISSYPFLSVHKHFGQHGILVPKVLSVDPARGMVLLEDLGDLTLERKFWENQNQELALPYYKQAIDELIKIHYPATDDKTDECTAFKIEFDVEKLLWELNYGREHLIEKLTKQPLSTEVRKELEKEFIDICRILHSEPKHICHRDYHSRNIMILRGRTRIIDFQDARLGPIQYDLVSLVYDSYVDINEALKGEILSYYLNKAKNYQSTPISQKHFDDIFKIQTVQRCFKACGSFASFYNAREDKRYLKYIKHTIQRVHSTLSGLGSFTTFKNVIEDNNLLGFDYNEPTKMVNP